MMTMDEVFANNSLDTVVVPPDFSIIIDNFTQEAKDLQDILDQQNQCDVSKEQIYQNNDPLNHTYDSNPQRSFVDITFTGNIGITSSFISQPWLINSPSKINFQSPLRASDLTIDIPTQPKAAHVSVITSVGNSGKSTDLYDGDYNMPANGNQLRHTQSAVVNKSCPQEVVRPRAHSAISCQQNEKKLSETTAQYVNLIDAMNPDKAFFKMPNSVCKNDISLVEENLKKSFPTYMNVPFPYKMKNETEGKLESNSAPNTPRGKKMRHSTSRSHINGSYIQLWADKVVEKDSLSDSECDEVKKLTAKPYKPFSGKMRQSGYVEMSSPYVRSPKTVDSFTDLAANLATYAGHVPRSIFCPFCPRYFGYEKSLSNHIQKAHYDELHKLSISPCEETFYQFCPICQARFFNHSILPKHLLECHKNSVIRILIKYECLKCNSSGIQCMFCHKKVPDNATGHQVLLYHMQHSHEDKLELMMESKFKPYFTGCKKYLFQKKPEDKTTNKSCNATPGLSGKLGDLKVNMTNNDQKEIRKPDDIKCTVNANANNMIKSDKIAVVTNEAKMETAIEKQCVNKGILRTEAVPQNRPCAKRELRFSVPHVTSEEIYTPESPEDKLKSIDSVESLNDLLDEEGSMPIRIDSLGSSDFIELTGQESRKRRRLGIGLKPKKAFKKKDNNKENINSHEQYVSMNKGKDKENIPYIKSKDKENFNFVNQVVSGFGKIKQNGPKVVTTSTTRTYRKPKPVSSPKVPTISLPIQNPKHVPTETTENFQRNKKTEIIPENNHSNPTSLISVEDKDGVEGCPFSNIKLFSPMRMFRCNGCRIKFCDNDSLSHHITSKHRGFLGILRPQYGCGVCSAKFYENKYLVKHCLQHHTSLLEIRSPKMHKVTIYRFSQD